MDLCICFDFDFLSITTFLIVINIKKNTLSPSKNHTLLPLSILKRLFFSIFKYLETKTNKKKLSCI